MKGQVSTELLVIVALVLLIFIPLLVLVYFKANEANQQIAAYQAELSVSRIASLANSVGSLGTDTSVITDVFIPPNTIALNISSVGKGGEISLTMDTPQGPTTPIVEIVKFPVNDVQLADSSNAGGWMRLEISSKFEDGQAAVEIKKVS
jgi:type II secretory pathway pseudopilin PulG